MDVEEKWCQDRSLWDAVLEASVGAGNSQAFNST